jgi:chloride channel 7
MSPTAVHLLALQSCSVAAPCYYSLASQTAMAIAYLPLFAASAALAIPGGLFMPALLLGGLFGAMFGFGLQRFLPDWHFEPGLYALCSATATLGGVFRTRQGGSAADLVALLCS